MIANYLVKNDFAKSSDGVAKERVKREWKQTQSKGSVKRGR